MKKRAFALSLMLVVLLFSCGCSQKKTEIIHDDHFVFGQDYQYQFGSSWYKNHINKSDNGYYFTVSDFLFYMDESTMQATPLCDLPNCVHEMITQASAIPECNACIGAADGEIYYYDGAVYYMKTTVSDTDRETKIIRCSSDGSSKDIFASVKNSKDNCMLVHRGYVYYSATEYVLTNERDSRGKTKINGLTTLYRLDLSDSNAKPESYLQNADFGLSGVPIIRKLSAYGDNLVIYAEESDLYSENGISVTVENNPIFSVDLNTKRLTDLTKISYPQTDAQLEEVTYLNGKIMFRLMKNDELSREVYTMNFDGTDIQSVFSLPEGVIASLYTDENYVYLSSLRYDSSGECEGLTLYVYDDSFHLLNTVMLSLPDPLAEGDGMLSSCGDKLMAYGVTYRLDENGEPVNEKCPVHYIKYINKSELLQKNSKPEWKLAYNSEYRYENISS